MGICVDNSLRYDTKEDRIGSKNNILMQSFVVNSITFEPVYNSKPGFFILDLPKYCQIQYIIRQSTNEQQSIQYTPTNIQLYINDLNEAITKMEELDIKSITKLARSREQQNYTQKSQRSQVEVIKPLDRTLNFQIINASISECQNNTDFPFEIYLNNKKVTTVMGEIMQNKWRPTSNNQICIHEIEIDLDDRQNQSKLKIVSKIEQQIQCIILLNRMTFRYLIAVPQTCNIRSKEDNQPLGNMHFKIQYWNKYEEHSVKVIEELKMRRSKLEEILGRNRDEEEGEVLKQIKQSFEESNNPHNIY